MKIVWRHVSIFIHLKKKGGNTYKDVCHLEYMMKSHLQGDMLENYLEHTRTSSTPYACAILNMFVNKLKHVIVFG